MTDTHAERTTDESTNEGTTRTTADELSRRRTLRLGGVAGVTGLLGVVDSRTGSASESGGGCNRPTDVVHLNYDEYDDWEDVYWASNGDPDNATLVSSPTYAGDTALQMQIDEGEHWGVSTHYEFDDGLFELNGRVRFALDTDWDMSGRQPANCRLWNCAMALGEGSAGGDRPDGTNGWSNRLYVSTKDADPDGPYNLLSFTYHMDQEQDHDYLIEGEEYTVQEPEIVPGRWYEFEYYVCVNTVSNGVANDDGIVQYWLDGDQIYDRRDLRFTADLEDNIIETSGPVGHYGGRYVAPRNLYTYYDQHSMALDGTFGRGC
ncbi:hypothetical protein [Halopiger aswanensis]|uniref:Polysaccharide lyase-like protein n=1 Tax=Halopiger aswanensis TaxID=148449 RepID=A0A419W1L3_9EURY|nr:hypothetical protein [Halopiger aswanensis]RKD89130.1 hypothetical protein ATJ93_3956 [Halopiger aswanensis]